MVQPQEKNDMIRITVVDGHELARTGARGLLKDAAGIKVIADAGGGERAVDLVRDLKFDVFFMDIQMPRIGGFKGSRSKHLRIRTSSVKAAPCGPFGVPDQRNRGQRNGVYPIKFATKYGIIDA